MMNGGSSVKSVIAILCITTLFIVFICTTETIPWIPETINDHEMDNDIIQTEPFKWTHSNYWKDLQRLSVNNSGQWFRRTQGFSLTPQIDENASVEVLQHCADVSQNHIIWIAGPPGAGKTTLGQHFKKHGFLVLDCEDSWNSHRGNTGSRLGRLLRLTEKAHKEFNTSFVFPACYSDFLLRAPKYVDKVTLLPNLKLYDERWKARNPHDSQWHRWRWIKTEHISRKDSILNLEQNHIETPDESCIRICEMIKNKKNVQTDTNTLRLPFSKLLLALFA